MKYMRIINNKDSKELSGFVHNTQPTDIVKFRGSSEKTIRELWIGEGKVTQCVPSDIFFNGTIPILDLKIDSHSVSSECRIKIAPNYRELIQMAISQKAQFVKVGLLTLAGIMGQYEPCTIFQIGIRPGENEVYFSSEVCASCFVDEKDTSNDYIKMLTSKVNEMDIFDDAMNVLCTWYGIQIALLNPTIKEVFKTSVEPIEHNNQSSNKKHKKQPIKYIKKHIINGDDINALLHRHNGNYERHTLAWYVTGHWRNYKTGKQSFIQPYWKGPLRGTRRDVEPRERELVV